MGPAALRRVLDQLGVVQIDSVNVLCRSHYLPFFARLGPYDPARLDGFANRAPRRMVEYWAHEASYVPPDVHRLLRWRMARVAEDAWGGVRSIAHERPELLPVVLGFLAEQGPATAREVERALAGPSDRPRDHWGWNWSGVKRALEHLFFAGEISSAGRNAHFERRYDVVERVLPREVLDAPDPEPADAVRELVLRAARACGVATEPSLRDWFRLRPEPVRTALDELVEAGELEPVRVRGWDSTLRRPAFRVTGTRAPRGRARALLTPFDPLIWHRPRTEELFGAQVRLEFYTPREKRVHGYYVMPFLLGENVVARVDVKSDRSSGPGGGGVLRVLSAWAEPGAPAETAEELAAELGELARFLGLDTIVAEPRGTLPALIPVLREGPFR